MPHHVLACLLTVTELLRGVRMEIQRRRADVAESCVPWVTRGVNCLVNKVFVCKHGYTICTYIPTAIVDRAVCVWVCKKSKCVCVSVCEGEREIREEVRAKTLSDVSAGMSLN